MRREHPRFLMSRSQRLIIYGVVGSLWLTGCVWLFLDQRSQPHDPFTDARSPWEPPIPTAHAVIAIGSVYLFGWMSSHHMLHWWAKHRRRVSGGTLTAVMILLAISDFALFFLSDDNWQHRTALVHDIFGVAAALFAMQHWFMVRMSNRRMTR